MVRGFMVRLSRLVDWPRAAIVDYDARFGATQRRCASVRRPRSADALPHIRAATAGGAIVGADARPVPIPLEGFFEEFS